MVSTHRLGLAILTAFSAFILLIALLVISNGWLLSEPQYTANSYDEVLTKEISLSLINLLIDIVILFLPIYIISFFFKSSPKVFTRKRILVILALVLSLSSLIIARSIHESFQLWQPLEQSTHSIEQRTFARGRGGGLGLQKSYTIDFTIKASDLSFIKNEVIPNLRHLGYEASDFSVSIGRQHYTSLSEPYKDDIYVQSIDRVPFTTPLSDLDYTSINFQRNKPYNSIYLTTDNYEGNGVVKGFIQAHY